MKLALVRVTLLAALLGAAASIVFAQVPQGLGRKTTSAEMEVRRLNAEEVEAFLHNDPGAMGRLWSSDFVVTNPLNKFLTKDQVLGMVQAGIL